MHGCPASKSFRRARHRTETNDGNSHGISANGKPAMIKKINMCHEINSVHTFLHFCSSAFKLLNLLETHCFPLTQTGQHGK